MPGPHIDKIVDEYIQKLDFEAPKGEDLFKLTKEQQKDVTTRGNKAYGTEIFKQIEAMKVTPEEKQEIFQRLAQHVVAKGVDEATDPTTLLREDSIGINMMTAYMNKYAAGYYQGVLDKANTAIKGTKLPTDDPNFPGSFPKPGTDHEMNSTLKGTTVDTLNDVYTDLGAEVLKATQTEAHRLSPEAGKFLQAISDTARDAGKPEMVSNLMASTLILRGVAPKMVSNAATSKDPAQKNLMLNSSVVLQSFVNTVDLDDPKMSKPQFKIVANLRNPESIGDTLKLFNATSQGADLKLPLQLQKMEKELASRKQGGFINWVKSIPDGGPKKAMAKLSGKIESAKVQIADQNDPEKYATKRKEGGLEQPKPKSVTEGQKETAPKVSTTVSDLAPKPTVSSLRDELGGKIKFDAMQGRPGKQEGLKTDQPGKKQTVGESMGSKKTAPTEGTGKHVHL